MPDMGSTSFDTNARMMDLGGLTDSTLGRPQTAASIGQYILNERRPDIARIHTTWIPLKHTDQLAWQQNGYVQAPALPLGFAGGDSVMYVRKDLFVSPSTSDASLGRSRSGVALQRVRHS